jgi:hypothetical protein
MVTEIVLVFVEPPSAVTKKVPVKVSTNCFVIIRVLHATEFAPGEIQSA